MSDNEPPGSPPPATADPPHGQAGANLVGRGVPAEPPPGPTDGSPGTVRPTWGQHPTTPLPASGPPVRCLAVNPAAPSVFPGPTKPPASRSLDEKGPGGRLTRWFFSDYPQPANPTPSAGESHCSPKMRAPRIDRVSKIVAVKSEDLAPGFDRVVLITPKSEVVLRCDPDSDEVIVSRLKKGKKKWVGTVLASGDFRVSWTWLMVNHQGYTDGFRIELVEAPESRVFEFVASCSAIEVSEVVKQRANQRSEPTAGMRPPSNQPPRSAVAHS